MPERKSPTQENPLDSLLVPLKAWVEAREAEKAKQAEWASLPDDIPRFVLRDP